MDNVRDMKLIIYKRKTDRVEDLEKICEQAEEKRK